MSASPFLVEVPPRSPDRFRAILAPEQVEQLERAIDEGRRLLDGHVVWNVNSTAKGGGVVELLRPLVGYARGAGVDARWVVIEGTPEFFAVTSEYFFSAPDVLHEAFPDVHAQLAAFYRQDPLVRLKQLQHSHPQYAEPH